VDSAQRPARSYVTSASVLARIHLAVCFEHASVDGHGLRINQDKRDRGRLRALVHPVVDRATLYDDVTSAEMHRLALVQLHVDLAGHDKRVVNGVRAM